MSIVKEVIIETVRRMPENITYKDAAIEIVDISNIFEHLEELSDEERQKLIDLIIPEVKISEEERKEIHVILEEMESGKEYRLEDVRAELNV
jgi:hypothetical protein